MALDSSGSLQKNEKLKPIQWYDNKSIIQKVWDAEDTIFTELYEIHNKSLYYVIDPSIK